MLISKITTKLGPELEKQVLTHTMMMLNRPINQTKWVPTIKWTYNQTFYQVGAEATSTRKISHCHRLTNKKHTAIWTTKAN